MMRSAVHYLSQKFHQITQLSKLFKKNEDGVVAVEFAFISVPFLIFTFTILEVALVFYAEINLTHATNETARRVRTLQSAISSPQDFVEDVCNRVFFFPDCLNKLKVEVRVHDSFSNINELNPLNGDGELKENFIFNLGGPGSVITVRTFAEWDLIAQFPKFTIDNKEVAIGLGNMANGNRLVEGFAAFRNEPLGISSAVPSNN